MPQHETEWYEERGMSFDLPEYTVANLKRGLELHDEDVSGEGLNAETVGDATRGVNDGKWSAKKWWECAGWLNRHNHDWSPPAEGKSAYDGANPGPSEVAWMLWGADATDQGPEDWARLEPCTRKKANELKERMRELDTKTEKGSRQSEERKAMSEAGAGKVAALRASETPAALVGRLLTPAPRLSLSSGIGALASALTASTWCMEASAGEALLRHLSEHAPAQRWAGGMPVAIRSGDVQANGDAYLYEGHPMSAELFEGAGVATLPLVGVMFERAGWGFNGYDWVRQQCRALAQLVAAGSLHTVVLRVSGPGGYVTGLWDCCGDLRALRALLEAAGGALIACIDREAYSAHQALAAQATKTYLPDADGKAGQAGVWSSYTNWSAAYAKEGAETHYYKVGDYKLVCAPDIPHQAVTDEQMQRGANWAADWYYQMIALGRGDRMTYEAAMATQARIYNGHAAIDAGFADYVGTFEEVLGTLLG